MEIKYVVCPGKVHSQRDRDVHYINAEELMRLYGVDPRECVVCYGDDRDLGKSFKGLITLHPRYDGDYDPTKQHMVPK